MNIFLFKETKGEKEKEKAVVLGVEVGTTWEELGEGKL